MYFFTLSEASGEGKRIGEEAEGEGEKFFVPLPLTFDNTLCSFLFNLWHSTLKSSSGKRAF
jgi:hypothetical protein